MTDEEMAEEYLRQGICQGCTNICEGDCAYAKPVKRAYLAGLKAGRPKWHKVADGDYPPCENGNYTINVLTNCEDIAYYSYNFDCWIAEPSSAEIDPPKAWCEIPKFEE